MGGGGQPAGMFPRACINREFKDVVFEDVVFDNDKVLPYPTLRVYLIWGHRTVIIKHRILKHHIPELPNLIDISEIRMIIISINQYT